MVITYSVILIGLLFLIRPLQKNSFYILHAALVILAAYYIETHYFRAWFLALRRCCCLWCSSLCR